MNKLELAYAHHWINKSGEIIKALAALEVTGYEIDDKLGLILHGKKPGAQEGDNVDAPLVGINGNQDTAVDARGICNAPGLFWAAVKDNTTVHGGEIGSKKDEEFLVTDETGFIQIGGVDTTPTPSRALVYRPGGGGSGRLRRGKLILSIPAAEDINTPGTAANAVQPVKWKDDGTGFENDGDPMMGVNETLTRKRGGVSASQPPVRVFGFVETVDDEKRFAIIDFDAIRGNPDYDITKTQIPYHADDEANTKLGGKAC